jgi:tryptophan synthase alpha chain
VIGSRLIQMVDAQPRDKVCAVAQGFLQEIRTALDS